MLPSESVAHWPTLEDNIEVSNAEAVTEWKGIKESIPPLNSTGNLQFHPNSIKSHNCTKHTYIYIKDEEMWNDTWRWKEGLGDERYELKGLEMRSHRDEKIVVKEKSIFEFYWAMISRRWLLIFQLLFLLPLFVSKL